MPRSPTTNVAHAALTDHRLLQNPFEIRAAETGIQEVVAWRKPASRFSDRDIALAEVLIGESKRLPALGEKGFESLEALAVEQRDGDAEALSALEGLSLATGNLVDAARYGRRVAELVPDSARAAMNLGVVLMRAGQPAEAETQFIRATQLDPSLKQAYGALVQLYSTQQRTADVITTLDRFLNWNPQDILYRIEKARSTDER